MNGTAKEIIPDMQRTLDIVVESNMRNARQMLGRLLCALGCEEKVNRNCLYQILQMDYTQVRDLLGNCSGSGQDECRVSPDKDYTALHTFATMQMMLQAYMSENMLRVAQWDTMGMDVDFSQPGLMADF